MADANAYEALLLSPQRLAGSEARPKRDAGWARALAVCAAVSLLGGVAAAFGW